jgi:hypothetical protein
MGVLLNISFVEVEKTYQYSRRSRRAIVCRDHFATKSGTCLSASRLVEWKKDLLESLCKHETLHIIRMVILFLGHVMNT